MWSPVAPYRIGGQRQSDDTVHRVLLFRFASDLGFNLGEIKLFLSGLRDKAPVGSRWKKLSRRKSRKLTKLSSVWGNSSRFLNTCFSATVPRSRFV